MFPQHPARDAAEFLYAHQLCHSHDCEPPRDAIEYKSGCGCGPTRRDPGYHYEYYSGHALSPGECADGSGSWYPAKDAHGNLIPICPSDPRYPIVKAHHETGHGIPIITGPDRVRSGASRRAPGFSGTLTPNWVDMRMRASRLAHRAYETPNFTKPHLPTPGITHRPTPGMAPVSPQAIAKQAHDLVNTALTRCPHKAGVITWLADRFFAALTANPNYAFPLFASLQQTLRRECPQAKITLRSA